MTEKTICSFYAEDHDVLDRAMIEFKRLKDVDFTEAKPFFRQFKSGLKRHILWEEEILFPVFEEKTGMKNSGPTAVMRQEHIRILAALELVHDWVRRADPGCDREISELVLLLKEHNNKEENILYPAIDSMIDPQIRRTVFEKMKRIPEERHEACGCSHV